MVEPVTDTLANTETAEMPVMETPASPVIEAVMKKPADAPKVIRKVAPAQPITRQAPEIAEEIPGTTTSRALSRLKGLVEDAPEENAFGLPKLATDGPSRRSASPGVQAPDLAEDNILNPTTSDDVLGTLERLRTALSRDITTNPMEVLKASRRAGAERMAKLLDQIKTVPPDTSLLRSRVLSPTQPEPVQPQKKASVDEFINDLADIRREPPRAVGPDRPIENTASVDADITDALLRDSAPPTEPVSEPLAPEGQPLNFEDRVTRIKRQAYAEEEILQKAAEDAAKDAKAADDAKAKQPLSDEQKKAMTVDALARYFKDEPDAKARMDGVSAEGYRTAPNIGQLNEPSEPTGKGLAAKALAAVGEPPSGQTVGKMNPGFLDKLARLFSNEEPAETGWSAQVEVDDPTPPTGLTAGGGTPAQQVPEVAQTGWTTSVELNAGDGNSVLLGVTETPVDRPVDVIEPVQPPPETAQQEPAAVAKQPTTPPVAALPAPDQTLAELDLPPVEPELPEIVAEPEPKPQPKPQPKLEPITEGNILEQIEARLRKREGLPPLEPDARGNRFDSGPEATAPAEARGLDAALYKLDELTPPTDSLDAKLGSLDEPTSKLDDSLDAAFGEPTEITAPVDKSLDAAFGEPVTESTVEAAESPKPGTAKRARRSAPPTLPYSDPLRAPVATTAAKSLPPLPTPRVTRAMPLRQPSAAEEAAQRAMHLERQEALTTGYPTPGQVAANQPASAPTLWPVTELAKNDSPTKPARPARPSMLSRTTLTGVQMSLGESVTLENSLPPEGGIDPNNECVKKNRGTTLFCIEPIDWPASISDKFQVPTILYTGPMAIVRFDQGTATRLHALFPSDDFEAVSAFYQTRYGTPTELWKRSIAPLAEPRRDNPTIAWRSRDPKTNVVSILELRKYDDTRGGFPDTNRGAVMLYTANSPPIFPQVSSHELMRIGRLKQAEGG